MSTELKANFLPPWYIEDLEKENKELKRRLEVAKEALNNCYEMIRTRLGYSDAEACRIAMEKLSTPLDGLAGKKEDGA